MPSFVDLPGWLTQGVLLGLLASLAVAGVFAFAARAYPTRRSAGPERSGDARRRVELRDYLDAVGESYAEDHPVEGYTVAFYLPERDVAITFDPRAFYAIERSPTHPILVEHEMPGVHLGARLPFETPEVTFSVGPADGDANEGAPGASAGEARVSAAFAALGLPASATVAEVKAAYREKAKEAHPDHGGDPAAFRRIQEAYATARERAETAEMSPES